MHFYEGADGLKTGHTDAAGYCLAATAKRNGLRLIGIVLGEKDASTRNSEMMQLLDYGFNTVKLNKLKEKGAVLKTVEVNKGSKDKVNLVLKNDLKVIEENGNGKRKYSFKYDINEIVLPIKKGTCVGKVNVIYKDKFVTSGELCVDEDVDKLNLFELYYSEFINLVCGNY